MKPTRRQKGLAAFALLWLLLIGAGFSGLSRYATTPAPLSQPPATWPAASGLQPMPGRATLVMALHPHCPCSRASLGELRRLLTRLRHTRLQAYLLVYRPGRRPPQWKETGLWHLARQIEALQITEDLDGRIAKRLNAFTSGQVVVYSPAGRLLFSGGLTAARGHEGPNAGLETIVAILTQGGNGRAFGQGQSATFGCPIARRAVRDT